MSAHEVYDLVSEHVDKHNCEIELGMTDTEKWRVVVICRKDPTKSGTGTGDSCLDAYKHLASKLKLGEEAPA